MGLRHASTMRLGHDSYRGGCIIGAAGVQDWVGGREDRCSFVFVVLRYKDKVFTCQLQR